MILRLVRYNHDAKSTQGLFFINGHFEAHVVEDEERCEKVHGQTRIPEGDFQVDFRKTETPLTIKYREKYDWFTWHLEIKNVPGFKWVYIHIGNSELDTEGCILVGDMAENDPSDLSAKIWKSTQAYKRIYLQIKDVLDRGEQVWITIEKM